MCAAIASRSAGLPAGSPYALVPSDGRPQLPGDAGPPGRVREVLPGRDAGPQVDLRRGGRVVVRRSEGGPDRLRLGVVRRLGPPRRRRRRRRLADEDAAARPAPHQPLGRQPLVRRDHRVAGDVQPVGQLPGRRQRLGDRQPAGADAGPELAVDLLGEPPPVGQADVDLHRGSVASPPRHSSHRTGPVPSPWGRLCAWSGGGAADVGWRGPRSWCSRRPPVG